MPADNQIVVLRYSAKISDGLSMDAGVGYLYRVALFEGKFLEEVDYITEHNPEYFHKFIKNIFGSLPDLDRVSAWDYAVVLCEETQTAVSEVVDFKYNANFD